MKLTITKITKKTVNTPHGQSEKYNFQTKETRKDGGNWWDSFCGLWNHTWKVGDVIDVQPDQLKSREYDGKTYWTIGAPAEAKQGFNLKPLIDDLANRVSVLEAKMFEIEMKTQEEPEIMEEDIPIIEGMEEKERIDVNDLPF